MSTNDTNNTTATNNAATKPVANKTAPSADTIPVLNIQLKDSSVLDTVVHDLHIMDQVFVVGFYDSSDKLIEKHNDHPFTMKTVKERDTDFCTTRAKCKQADTSWRVLVLKPTPKAIRYMEELNFTLNFIDGSFDNLVGTLL